MRWRTTKPTPKPGDVRYIRRFAWLPVEIRDHTVWLERYEATQRLVLGVEEDRWEDIGRDFCVYY